MVRLLGTVRSFSIAVSEVDYDTCTERERNDTATTLGSCICCARDIGSAFGDDAMTQLWLVQFQTNRWLFLRVLLNDGAR